MIAFERDAGHEEVVGMGTREVAEQLNKVQTTFAGPRKLSFVSW